MGVLFCIVKPPLQFRFLFLAYHQNVAFSYTDSAFAQLTKTHSFDCVLILTHSFDCVNTKNYIFLIAFSKKICYIECEVIV